jgi:hypothetical protein
MLADANDIVCSPATHDTSVTCQITNAQTDYQDIYYVSCEDIATNRNGGSNNYEFIYTYSSSAPPEVISHEPADIITSTSTNLQVTTSEDAKCRYSTTADTAYDSMGSLTETSSFSTTPSWPLSDLEEGLHDYYIRCKDILDNKAETDYHISFTVDVSLPSTSYTPPGGWQKTDIEVNLDCTDDNTCAATYYTTDGTTPTEDSSSGNTFTLTTEGTHTIKYYSVDEAGNEEAVQSATIKIDKTAPSIDTGSVTVSPDVWRTEGTSTYDITLTSTEELSGFKQLRAYINEDGDNSVNRRGQIGWHPANPLWEDSDEVDCTGGGVASKHPTSDGADLITITACSTEQTGDVRTVTFTIDPADSFGEFDNNDISMWTKDVATNTRGWNNFNIDFSSDSTPPSIGTCLPPSDAPEFPKIECTVDEPNLGLCGMYTTDTSITSMWPCDNIEGGTSCTAQGDPGDGPEDRSLITYYIKCNDQAGYESTTKAHEYYRDPTPSVEPQVDDDSITPTPGSIIAAEPLSVSFEITKRGRCIALLDPDTSDATSYDLSYTDMLDEDEVDCRTTNTLPPYDLTCNFPTLGAEGEKSVHISCEELEDSPLSSTSGSNKDITYTFDATAPSITATGPSGTFPTDSITLTAETDEQAQCRYSTTSQGYADMTSADSPLSQIHSWTITAAEETNNYFISCSDTINPMTSASPVTFKVDTTPPTIQYTGSTPAHESMVSTDSFTVEAQSTDDNNRYIVGDLDQKLLGWYRFEDADVNTLVDDSTHTTTASNNDALSVPGKFGQALEFPGTSSVSVPDLGSQLVDGFTYQAWVLTYTGNDGEQRGIMSQASSPFLVKRMDGNLGVRLDFTTAGSNWYCNSGTIPINTWSHLAFTWDSSTETLKTYINGVQDCTESTPAGDTLAPIAGNFYIGKTKDDDQYWNGQIDEVQVHKRALSAEEIQSSIDGSTPYSRTYSDLADLHYTFNVFTADEAGHMASETERQVTVDTQGPVIDLTGTPGEFTSAEAVTYSGTATDASSEVVDVQYKLTTTATIQDWTSLSPTPAVEVTFSFDLDPIDTGVYTVFIKAKDGVDQWTEITAPLTVDRTPPTIDTDSVGPSGTVTTSEVTLTVSATDEPVNCRFSTSPSDTTYDDMSNDFETRGVLTNTHQITGLTDLTPETTYYIACQDLSGNDYHDYPDPLSTTFDVNIPEDCDNEVDDDGNGDIDCTDTDCIGKDTGPNGKTCCVDNTNCDYDSDCQDFEDGSRECLSVYDIDGNSETCCISYGDCEKLVDFKTANPAYKFCLDGIGYTEATDEFTLEGCSPNNVVTFDTCFDQPGRCDGACCELCLEIGKVDSCPP